MTTGTRTLDGRFTQGNSASGSALVGRYFKKTWNGGDRPPTTEYKTLVHPLTKEAKRVPIRRARTVMDVPHNYTCTIEDYSIPNIYCWGPRLSGTYCENYGAATPVWDSSPWTSNLDIALIADLCDEIYGSSFDPGVFLGELNQTLGLLGGSAMRLYNGLNALTKGRFREAAVAFSGSKSARTPKSKTIGSAWLELQYGWKPLVNDMYECADFIAHELRAPITLTFKARRSASKPHDRIVGDRVQPSVTRRRVRKQIIAYISEKNLPSGLSLVNPATVLWEKLPWSFVVDWAIPIGNYLSARGAASALTGTFVTTTVDHIHWSGQKPADKWITKVYPPPWPWRHDQKTMNRNVSTSLNVPLPGLKPLGKVASWAHAENALALLTQRFK